MVEGGKIREREAGRAGSGKTPTWWCELSRYGERCVLGKGWCTSISPFLQPQNLFHPLLITPCCPPDPGLGTEMQDFRFRLWALLQGPQEEHSRDVLMERGPEQRLVQSWWGRREWGGRWGVVCDTNTALPWLPTLGAPLTSPFPTPGLLAFPSCQGPSYFPPLLPLQPPQFPCSSELQSEEKALTRFPAPAPRSHWLPAPLQHLAAPGPPLATGSVCPPGCADVILQ